MQLTDPLTNQVPRNPVQRAIWMNYQMKAAGTPQSALAKKLGVDPSAVSAALRRRHYPAIEREIAAVIGLPVETLWPERYISVTPQDDRKNARTTDAVKSRKRSGSKK